MSGDVCSFVIKNCFNTFLASSSFPVELKRAPVYKKDDATCVENYRPCNAYVLSHLQYCPLIWMRFDKASNFNINRVHRRALSVIYQSFNSILLDLLSLSKGVTLHISYIQKLLQEILKSVNGLNPSFMSEQAQAFLFQAFRNSFYPLQVLSNLAYIM